VAIYDYPGVQHAFSRPRGDHYAAAADALARARTLKALREVLR
jgi:carboxymethylenebutenolidase